MLNAFDHNFCCTFRCSPPPPANDWCITHCRETLFRQLCCLHWILKAMDITENSTMSPLITCWQLRYCVLHILSFLSRYQSYSQHTISEPIQGVFAPDYIWVHARSVCDRPYLSPCEECLWQTISEPIQGVLATDYRPGSWKFWHIIMDWHKSVGWVGR